MSKEIVGILHNIRSRENVGSMFRTADAAGVSKLYLCGITPRPPHEKIAKTALGAEQTVPWEYIPQTWRLIEKLKKDGYHIIALEKTKAAQDIFQCQPQFPCALIMGNEVSGIPANLLRRANAVAAIPQQGQKESLNVAVAFGVAAYVLVYNKP